MDTTDENAYEWMTSDQLVETLNLAPGDVEAAVDELNAKFPEGVVPIVRDGRRYGANRQFLAAWEAKFG